MIEFRMPSLGADMEAGTLVEWLVKPGDTVKRGDVVAVVETQKGAIEIEIFNNGVVSELAVPVGQSVPVGSVLARLDGEGVAAAPTPPPPAPTPAAVVIPPTLPPAPPPIAQAPLSRVQISPAARRLASERGIDTGRLKGTGPGGAITIADVEGAKPAAPPEAPKRRTGFDPAAMRQAIAAAMSRSKREIPHYYLSQTVEVSAALKRLEKLNADRAPPERILPAALFLRAVALAMAKLPELNGFWEDGRFRPGEGVHTGWAIALRGGGLVAPAIRDADKRSLDELMAAMRHLVQRARSYGLRSSELSDPTRSRFDGFSELHRRAARADEDRYSRGRLSEAVHAGWRRGLSRPLTAQAMEAASLAGYEHLSPFEIKDELIRLAHTSGQAAAHVFLNAGRGNPNWVATRAREIFFLLGQFAIGEATRVMSHPAGIGGMPRATGIADRLDTWLADRDPAITTLLRDATARFGFQPDAFIHELVDAITGDQLPGTRPHARARRTGGARIPDAGDVRRRDRIALGTPIFTPYLEILRRRIRSAKTSLPLTQINAVPPPSRSESGHSIGTASRPKDRCTQGA